MLLNVVVVLQWTIQAPSVKLYLLALEGILAIFFPFIYNPALQRKKKPHELLQQIRAKRCNEQDEKDYTQLYLKWICFLCSRNITHKNISIERYLSTKRLPLNVKQLVRLYLVTHFIHWNKLSSSLSMWEIPGWRSINVGVKQQPH